METVKAFPTGLPVDVLDQASADALYLKLDQTTPQVITATDTTITASDELYFGDVTDSSKMKKDTVQGILDLVPSPDLSAYVSKTDFRQVKIDGDLYGMYLVSPVKALGIVTFGYGFDITVIQVKCYSADPTTELNANIMKCDSQTSGAFPSTNQALIRAIDTTAGDLLWTGSDFVEDGKEIYLLMDANVDYGVMWRITIGYRLRTS